LRAASPPAGNGDQRGVAQWNDKGCNNWTLAQTTSANQPAYLLSGINGLGSISFNGTSDELVTSTNIPFADMYPASSVFIVQNTANSTGFTLWAGSDAGISGRSARRSSSLFETRTP
jgi:hypothetical protein